MEKTEYTVQEAYVIETIFKKPNIKQIDLASHCLISSRILRKVINSIRKKEIWKPSKRHEHYFRGV
jgi:hypothetical protein